MKSKSMVFVSIIVIALVAVWIGTAVMAQRGPGGPGGPPGAPGGPGGPGMQPPMGPGPIMKAGAQGVFVLWGPTLTKYDAALKEKGSLQLIGPPTDNPPAEGDQKPPMPPMPPNGILLIAPAGSGASEKVIALFGDQLVSVDAASLKIAAKAKLPAPEMPKPPDGTAMGNPQGPGMMMPQFFGPPPPIELQGRVLYILRGPQIVGVNVEDGKIVGPAALPKPQPPAGD